MIIIDTLNDLKKLPAAARFSKMQEDWSALRSAAAGADRSLPVGANSYSSTLVTNFLESGAITNLQNRLGALAAFTRYFGTDAFKPRATAEIKNVTSGPTVQTNATNFESGDATVGPLTATVSQYSVSSHVSNDELNSGLRLADLVTITTAALANKILQTALAPITLANFSTLTPLASAAADFGYSDLATLWGQLKKSTIKNLIIESTYLSRVINQPTFYQKTGTGSGAGWQAFGWDLIVENSDFTGADSGVFGFACNPQAIALVAGLPLSPPQGSGTLQQGTFLVPGPQLYVQTNAWLQLSSRTGWMSYDIMLGATAGDTSAGVIIKSP